MQWRLSKDDGVDECGSSSSSAEPGLDSRMLCICETARLQDSKTASKVVSARAVTNAEANAMTPE